MSKGLLTRYIEAGIPYLREITEMPEWLVPDVPAVVRLLGDGAMLDITKPLEISGKVQRFLSQAPVAEKIPAEVWRDGIRNWEMLHWVMPVALELLRACEKIEALERRGVKLDYRLIVRGLATISFATFVPDGGKILERLATIMGGSPSEPPALITIYVNALENNHRGLPAKVEECVSHDPAWDECSQRFIEKGVAFPFRPKVIGVRPRTSEQLIHVLANMFMEVMNADSRPDSRN